jgi:hypothetical protein
LKIRLAIKKHPFDDQDVAIFVLNARIINSLACLQNLIQKGYYNDSFAILRNVHQSIWICNYLIKYPNKVDYWLDGGQISYKSIKDDLNPPEIYQQLFGRWSDYVHSNVDSTIDHFLFGYNDEISKAKKEDIIRTDIRVNPMFNKYIVDNLLIAIVLLSLESMESFYKYFNKYYWINFDSHYEEEKNELIKKVSNISKSWKKRHSL